MGTNKLRGCGSPARSQGGDEREMLVNMLRHGHLQKLHITDSEIIKISEQGVYMPPEKGQGNKNTKIKESTSRMM